MGIVRALAALAIVTAGTIGATAGPAAAKGPETVTLTGPGIDGEVVVAGWAVSGEEPLEEPSDEFPSYLHLALRQFTETFVWGTSDTVVSEEPPASEDLGPKYTLTWDMAGPTDADPADYTVVQELYPETSFERAYIHTLASPYTRSPDVWVPVDPVLADILEAYTTGPAASPIVAETPLPPATGEPSSGLHPLVTLPVALVTFAAVLTLGRHRHRRSPQAPTAAP